MGKGKSEFPLRLFFFFQAPSESDAEKRPKGNNMRLKSSPNDVRCLMIRCDEAGGEIILYT